MEVLTGIMIAILIFVSAKLVSKNELEVSNFFSFLAAMMLAYQPVRSLATLNIGVQQGLSGSRRVLPIIDQINEIKDVENAKSLLIKKGEIDLENVSFEYNKNENQSALVCLPPCPHRHHFLFVCSLKIKDLQE